MEETTGALSDSNHLREGNNYKPQNTNFIFLGIIRRFVTSSGTTGTSRLLGKSNPAGDLYTIEGKRLQPLMQLLETLKCVMQDLEEGTTST